MLAISITMMGQTSPKKVKLAKDTIENAATTAENINSDSTSTNTVSVNGNSDDDSDLKSLKELGNFSFDGTPRDLIAIIAIISVFGMPVLIIFIIFLFRYKTKTAQCRVAEKSLESGKEVPEGLFKNDEELTNLNVKGIKNLFLGFGLGIFLWAITGEFGIGCIGFMIMFMGIGQVVIYYTQKPANKDKKEEKPNE